MKKEAIAYAPLFPYLAARKNAGIVAEGELIVDNFAGGGGASTGLEQALGRPVDIAINHDAPAIAMHQINHPYTQHFCESVWEVDPVKVTAGRPVALAWFSPDCKHFSKAKGGKPVSKEIRGLAWVALRWAATVRPRVIIVENVEEFKTWGPLGPDNRPCPEQSGRTFRSWVNALRRQGYQVDCRELVAYEYGAPTSRKRLFIVARCDGQPIVWPTPTHGKPSDPRVLSGELKVWRTAAECIDWDIPCPSIFGRKKTLVVATHRRIAQGILRYTLRAARPFVVTCNHQGETFRGMDVTRPAPTIMAARDAHGAVLAQVVPQTRTNPARPVDAPLNTATTQSNAHTLVTASAAIVKIDNRGSWGSGAYSVELPLGTEVAKQSRALSTVQLVRQNGGHCKPETAPYPVTVPAKTVTSNSKPHDLLAVHLTQYNGCNDAQNIAEPSRTIPTKDRFGLTTAQIVRQQRNDVGHATDVPAKTVMPGGGGGKSQLVQVHAGTGLSDEQLQGARRVYAFLQEHLDTAVDPYADHEQQLVLVQVDGETYVITDIGMRMLEPRELYRAQGFPETYRIDFDVNSRKPLSKTAQTKMCGNAVPPQFSRAVAHANLAIPMQEAAD